MFVLQEPVDFRHLRVPAALGPPLRRAGLQATSQREWCYGLNAFLNKLVQIPPGRTFRHHHPCLKGNVQAVLGPALAVGALGAGPGGVASHLHRHRRPGRGHGAASGSGRQSGKCFEEFTGNIPKLYFFKHQVTLIYWCVHPRLQLVSETDYRDINLDAKFYHDVSTITHFQGAFLYAIRILNVGPGKSSCSDGPALRQLQLLQRNQGAGRGGRVSGRRRKGGGEREGKGETTIVIFRSVLIAFFSFFFIR